MFLAQFLQIGTPPQSSLLTPTIVHNNDHPAPSAATGVEDSPRTYYELLS